MSIEYVDRIEQLNDERPCDIHLAVVSSEIKQTSAGSPYLAVDLTDGIQTLRSHIWDWHKPKIPTNTVVLTRCRTSEYNGKAQLQVITIVTDPDIAMTRFMPQCPVNIDEQLEKVYRLVEEIQNPQLKALAQQLFFSSDWNALWRVVPAALRNHHNYVAGTLYHSVCVVEAALGIASNLHYVNKDLIIAGGLLHDIGKLLTYYWKGITIEMTMEGKLFDHIVLGVKVLEDQITDRNRKIIHLIQHIILSHHGNLEWGSPVTPVFKEAYIIHMADRLDSRLVCCEDAENASVGKEWTEKVFSMNNRELLTQDYIKGILGTNL